MPWTKERLELLARERLGASKFVVVANRESYIHTLQDGEIRCLRPASGLTTALNPVMQACGGVWVGHGSGDADRDVGIGPDAPRAAQIRMASPRHLGDWLARVTLKLTQAAIERP